MGRMQKFFVSFKIVFSVECSLAGTTFISHVSMNDFHMPLQWLLPLVETSYYDLDFCTQVGFTVMNMICSWHLMWHHHSSPPTMHLQSMVPIKEPEVRLQTLLLVQFWVSVSKTLSCQLPASIFINTWSYKWMSSSHIHYDDWQKKRNEGYL